MTDIKQALTEARAYLNITSPSATLDAEILLAHTLGRSRAYLYTYPEQLLNTIETDHFQRLLASRHTGMPIAYLTGEREFWSLPLRISSATLIPRSDTELLIERALILLDPTATLSVLDLGTGSGAIAMALATERPHWQILAVDSDPEALHIAQHNRKQLGLSNVCLMQSDWFQSIPKQFFDLIVSNPPYIATDDPHLKEGDLRFEPPHALISGPQGLDDLTTLIDQSYDYLSTDGLLLLEHGFQQKKAVLTLLHQRGYKQTQCWQDMAGQDRISGGRKR